MNIKFLFDREFADAMSRPRSTGVTGFFVLPEYLAAQGAHGEQYVEEKDEAHTI